ncbi:SIMPL domain-containing protein [Maribacter chungangensis]|uniref:SIMPL domain-containing protein n=1 Tax=Maribacter chungangensis TaxID=1069117 RepID=A0ABW3B047_9FLAO
MKKTMTLIVLFAAIIGNAQTKETQRTTTVMGSATLEREVTAYKIKVTLNMDQVYYADPQCKTLEEFKDKYYAALTREGFDPSQLVEKKMEFMTLGYQKEGTILQLETTSKEMAEKLMKVRLNGVSLQFNTKNTLTAAKRSLARKEALEDARTHAEELCKIAGKSLGEIVYISENTPVTGIWKSYYDSYEEYFSITVGYQMK